jgi:hypothetical protein
MMRNRQKKEREAKKKIFGTDAPTSSRTNVNISSSNDEEHSM